ncbi:pyruvate kinase [Orrella marina]|uniref:Pyruvate kinase n=1 Tax=Orrella marina TaxID=2163011 RepID=A0A2R4XGE8_9BURK|nr:pyruvate kinase [Orrella marina]AWB32861.1 pyruvate kinase [Orrella marina]
MKLDAISHRARNAKILATLGPASSDADTIRALFDAGVDVFRFNFSHGTHEDHRKRYELVRQIEREVNRPVGILMDLQGPKLRLGVIEGGRLAVKRGDVLTLDLDPAPGTAERLPMPHPPIFEAVKPGDDLLIDDGKVRLKVLHGDAQSARVEVCNDGVLSDRKGVNVPGALLALSAMTDKDRADLAFGLELGVDWVALSFVQRAEDIEEIKALVAGRAWVMAKLEKPAAIESLEAIVEASDAVMVARGDLGVEKPPEDVPILQKRIIRVCREVGKPVVVATQMLESMIASPVPTRAEVSDVAGAIYDGVDAVMLSAESASGQYPVQAVTMMDRILRATEQDPMQRVTMQAVQSAREVTARDAISAAIRTIAETLPVAATVAYTSSGATALRVAHERPRTPILSMTPNLSVARRLTLVWGVHSTQSPDVRSSDEIVHHASQAVRRHGFGEPGKAVLIAAGTPFGVSGTTNLLRVTWLDGSV